jgi:hypothetical protein
MNTLEDILKGEGSMNRQTAVFHLSDPPKAIGPKARPRSEDYSSGLEGIEKLRREGRLDPNAPRPDTKTLGEWKRRMDALRRWQREELERGRARMEELNRQIELMEMGKWNEEDELAYIKVEEALMREEELQQEQEEVEVDIMGL